MALQQPLAAPFYVDLAASVLLIMLLTHTASLLQGVSLQSMCLRDRIVSLGIRDISVLSAAGNAAGTTAFCCDLMLSS